MEKMAKFEDALNKNSNIDDYVKQHLLECLLLLNIHINGISEKYICDKLENFTMERLPSLVSYQDVKCTGDVVTIKESYIRQEEPLTVSMEILLKKLFPCTEPRLEFMHDGITLLLANSLDPDIRPNNLNEIRQVIDSIIRIYEADKEHKKIDLLTCYFNGNFGNTLPIINKVVDEEIMGSSELHYMCIKNNKNSPYWENLQVILNEKFQSKNPTPEERFLWEINSDNMNTNVNNYNFQETQAIEEATSQRTI